MRAMQVVATKGESVIDEVVRKGDTLIAPLVKSSLGKGTAVAGAYEGGLEEAK
jgi:hypothetical protein